MLKRRLISTQRHRRAFAHLASEFEVIIADHCEEDEKDNDGDNDDNDDYDYDKKQQQDIMKTQARRQHRLSHREIFSVLPDFPP